MNTGEKITIERKKIGYTQEQFAEYMEVTRQSVSKWEKNAAYPETEKIIRMCELFHCSIDYILRDEIEDSKQVADGRSGYCKANLLPGKSQSIIDEKKSPSKGNAAENRQTIERPGEIPMLKLEGVSKHYIKGDKINPVLVDVDANFYEGEFIAITGESGCGKTTLMNLISGALSYDSGEISFNGKKYSDFDGDEWIRYESETIGYIAQDNKLLMQYTVEQNILSALLIRGESISGVTSKIEEILEIIGLADFKDQRIVKLSAGQRQRVAIGRMLAKDAKIILADEAVANLDRETGDRILQVLKKISKDRLVILITHSYPQCEKYVSRHIKLMNRGIASDVLVNEPKHANVASVKADTESDTNDTDFSEQTSNIVENSEIKAEKTANYRRAIRKFSRWNLKARKGATASVFLFLFLLCNVIFILGTVYFSNADEITIKQYDPSAFRNENDCRLVVTRTDGADITDEDLAAIEGAGNVVGIEKYDLVTDILYFYDYTKDFEIEYLGLRNGYKLKREKFMKSASSIKADSLVAGRMPEAIDEVLVSEDEADKLDQEMFVCFRLPSDTEEQQSCRKLTVVGVCKDEDQLYFSDQLCEMFSALRRSDVCSLKFEKKSGTDEFRMSSSMIPVIKTSLEGNECENNFYFIDAQDKGNPVGECRIEATKYERYGLDEPVVEKYDVNVTEYIVNYDESYFTEHWVIPDSHVSFPADFDSFPYISVSEEMFYKLKKHGTNQMGAYIKDYIYTDKAIAEIEKIGPYKCISTYRTSKVIVDEVKKTNRARIYGIIAIFVVVFEFISIMILMMISGLWKNDFTVLKHLGMSAKTQRQTIFSMYLIEILVAFIFSSLILMLLKLVDLGFLHEYLKYMRLAEYIICTVVIALLMAPIVMISTNHILSGANKPRKYGKEENNDRS